MTALPVAVLVLAATSAAVAPAAADDGAAYHRPAPAGVREHGVHAYPSSRAGGGYQRHGGTRNAYQRHGGAGRGDAAQLHGRGGERGHGYRGHRRDSYVAPAQGAAGTDTTSYSRRSYNLQGYSQRPIPGMAGGEAYSAGRDAARGRYQRDARRRGHDYRGYGRRQYGIRYHERGGSWRRRGEGVAIEPRR